MSSGGGAVGGKSTPNAGMGGGGPTGGGGLDLHLPSATALQGFTASGSDAAAAAVSTSTATPNSMVAETAPTVDPQPLVLMQPQWTSGSGPPSGMGSFTTTEGTNFAATLAVASGGSGPPPTSVSINWGDGSSSNGSIVPIVDGTTIGYNFNGNHVYKEETNPNSITVTVTVTYADNSTQSATDQMTVNDAPLTGNNFVAQPVEGTNFTAPLVYFRDANAFATAADFTATMNWGDGSSNSPAAVTAVNPNSNGQSSLFQVSVPAGHVYTDAGSFQASVTINDDGGSMTTINGTLNVQDAALTMTSPSSLGTFTQGTALNNVTVANLVDKNPLATAADFTVFPGYVSINWGDGTSDNNAAVSGSPSNFVIQDTHTYNAPGNYSILVTAHDDDGNTAESTTTVTIRPNSAGTILPGGGTGGSGSDGCSSANEGPVANNVPANRTLLPLGEAQIAPATGGVEVSQPLDFDQSPGTSVGRDPALIYNSDTVDVHPILPITVWTTPGGTVPTSITATLTWNGTAEPAVTFTPAAGSQPGQAYLLDLQVPLSQLPVAATGVYPYSIEVTFNDGTAEDITAYGDLAVVVTANALQSLYVNRVRKMV